jgi:hypothetical protein
MSKRKNPKIVSGVTGTEISLFVRDINKPEIKVTFLHKGNDIFEEWICLFIRKDIEDDSEIRQYLSWLNIEIKMGHIQKVNEVYQTVNDLITQYDLLKIRNFNVRHLNLNPAFQVRLPHPNFVEYKGVR